MTVLLRRLPECIGRRQLKRELLLRHKPLEALRLELKSSATMPQGSRRGPSRKAQLKNARRTRPSANTRSMNLVNSLTNTVGRQLPVPVEGYPSHGVQHPEDHHMGSHIRSLPCLASAWSYGNPERCQLCVDEAEGAYKTMSSGHVTRREDPSSTGDVSRRLQLQTGLSDDESNSNPKAVRDSQSIRTALRSVHPFDSPATTGAE